MTRLNKIRLLLAVAGILVVGGAVAFQKSRQSRELYRENIGTVTTIDPSTRQAGLEIIHPRTGQKLSLTGTLPDECPITIDGAVASFDDIRAGDRVLLKRRGLNILAVDVRRAAEAAESAPAPVGGGPQNVITASQAE